MKECDKRKSHIRSKLLMIYISSNTVRHPITKTATLLHYTSPTYPPRHYTCRYFTSCHLNFTQLHNITLSFGLAPFKFPTAPFHFTSLHFTPLHYTCRHFTSCHLNFTPIHILIQSVPEVNLTFPFSLRRMFRMRGKSLTTPM